MHRALPGGASLRCEQNVHVTYIQGRLRGNIAGFQWCWRNLGKWGGWWQNFLWFRRGWGIPRTTWEATLPGNSSHEWEKNLQIGKTHKTWTMVGPSQVPLHTRNLVWSESVVGPQTRNTVLLIMMKLAKVLMQHTLKWRVESTVKFIKLSEFRKEVYVCFFIMKIPETFLLKLIWIFLNLYLTW